MCSFQKLIFVVISLMSIFSELFVFNLIGVPMGNI